MRPWTNRPAEGGWAAWVLAVALWIATVLLFWQVGHHDYITFDDPTYVSANPHLDAGISVEGVRWAFSTRRHDFYHPVTWLSHLLDVQLFGRAPGPQHLVNAVLHGLNAALLLLVLARLTGSPLRSATVAALFAWHPLHVESVAWIAERKDVLYALFWILALAAYCAYCARPGVARYVVLFALYLLGLMSKPMMVTLPVVLLLLDYWPLGRLRGALPAAGARSRGTCTVGQLVLEKIPLLACGIAWGWLTVVLQAGGAIQSFEDYPIGLRVGNAALAYMSYIGQTLVPLDLAYFYPYRQHPSLLAVAGGLFFVAAITVLLVRFRDRAPYLPVGWLWFVLTLAPVIGLIQSGAQARADRFTYVPLVGLFVALTWAAAEVAGRTSRGTALAGTAGGAILLLCVLLTHRQVGHWRDGETLYRHAIRVTRDNYLAHDALGVVLAEQGRLDEAVQQYRLALEARPEFSTSHNNLGVALAERGQLAEAIESYREALRLQAGYPAAHNNLGIALARSGRPVEAAREFGRSIESDPANADAHRNLGLLLQSRGEPAGAVRHYREATRLRPDWTEVLRALAWILASSADPAVRDGEAALRAAQASCPAGCDSADGLDTLAAAHAAAGRFEEAVALARRGAAAAEAAGLSLRATEIRSREALYRSRRAVVEGRSAGP